MSRFQALTNRVLDAELEMLRDRFGLASHQRADLLREVAALAAWVVRQSEQGRAVVARRGNDVEPLVHPTLERLRAVRTRALEDRIELNDQEVRELATVLGRRFDPPPAFRRALANLGNPRRRAPKLRWKKSERANA